MRVAHKEGITVDQRLRSLLTELLTREEPVTLAELADRVKVSRRTVQEDLDKLDEDLQRWPGAAIQRQPRRGIWLDASPDVRRQMADSCGEGKEGLSQFSPADRQHRLIGLLLADAGPTTMQALADQLFFSRVTIQKDLEAVSPWFSAQGLVLQRRPRQGIELVGSEAAWRKAVAQYLVEVAAEEQILQFLRTVSPDLPGTRLDVGSIREMRRLFPSIDLKLLEEAVRATEAEMGFRFSDEAYAGLVVHLAVTVERMRQGKAIRMPTEQLREFSAKREYQLAADMAGRLQGALGLTFPEAEIGYISLHLLGAKVQANLTQPDELQETLAHLDPHMLDLARRMAALAEKALDIPLQEDIQLLTGLALHLRPTINRLKHGLGLRNPVLDELKRAYPSLMGVAWLAAAILEEEEGISVAEEEVGYLALHLGAAVERARSRRRVLVVCGSGLGTAQLVASRLRASFPDLDIAGVVPSLLVPTKDLEAKGIDLIISTVPVPNVPIPVVRVHPLLRNEDIDRLARYLGGMPRAGHVPAPAAEPASDPVARLRTLLDGRLFRVRCWATSRQGVLAELGRALADAGCVEDGFVASVRQRESITSTAIGKGVAIPHAEGQYTREAAIALGALPQPIDWDGESVDLVFLLALDPKRPHVVENVARELYQLINDDQALNRLRTR